MTEIKALERLKICLECGDCLLCNEHDEAIGVAINVLREKFEREKKCIVCYSDCNHNPFISGYKYCPYCGRKL